jgi:hypothetical protein
MRPPAVAAAGILNGKVKRCGAAVVAAARLGATGQQRFDRRCASGADGAMQWRYAALVGRIWIGAGPDQTFDRGRLRAWVPDIRIGGVMKRLGSAPIFGGAISASIDKSLGDFNSETAAAMCRAVSPAYMQCAIGS